jgi:hypothetical protein
VVPLQLKDEGRTLVVAMTDPLNVQALDTLRAVSRCRIAPVLAGKGAVERAQGRFYRGESEVAPIEEESFKFVDAQGRTVRKDIGEIEAERKTRANTDPEIPAPAADTPGQQLRALEELQRKEVAALKAMVELLVEKGVFSRDEYLAKVRK